MRKAFTMIELIFVIVILGILAVVAIPRLVATRDDAEMSKAASNLSTMITDLSAYYTSSGNFTSDITKMTNVMLVDSEAKPISGEGSSVGQMYLQVKKALCFKIELGIDNKENSDFKRSDMDDINGDYLKNADSIEVTAVSEGLGSKICAELFTLPAIKSIMTSSNISVEDGTNKVFTIGGTGVVYETIDFNTL